MSRSSQMVLARCNRAALLNPGFLNCTRGARSEYLGTRRLSAGGTKPGRAADDGASAGAGAAGTSVASGAGVASGLLGWMVWVMAPPMVKKLRRWQFAAVRAVRTSGRGYFTAQPWTVLRGAFA